MHKCCIYGELIHLLIPYTHGLCSVSSQYSLKSKFTQKLVLIIVKKENWGSLERAVCSAPRMTGELPSPLTQTPCARVLSSDTVCPPTPAKLAHISTLHWELHTADWESVRLLRNWHTSALHSSSCTDFTSARELLTHTSCMCTCPAVRISPRNPTEVCTGV